MSAAVPWCEVVRHPERAGLIATYCDTLNPLDLSIFADHCRTSGDGYIVALGEHIHDQIELSDIFPCPDIHRRFPAVDCRFCDLSLKWRNWLIQYSEMERGPGQIIKDLEPIGGRARRPFIENSPITPSYVMPRQRRLLKIDYLWKLGVPHGVRCEGCDFVSILPWLRDKVPLGVIDLVTPPAVGVKYLSALKRVEVVVIGIPKAAVRVDAELVGGRPALDYFPDNEYLIEQCIRNALPLAEVKIRVPGVELRETRSIMNLVGSWGGQRRGFLEYAPQWIDPAHERQFAEYR